MPFHFVCDTMRMAASGGIEPFDVDQMIEPDMEVHHHDATQPGRRAFTMADALPGLGIVAAVLGVVITMGALGGPPEEIGHKVAAALVGTFLGILLCYGLIGPIAANMAKATEEEHALLSRAARSDRALYQGIAAHHCGGVRAARDPGECAAHLSGTGKIHQGRRRRGPGEIDAEAHAPANRHQSSSKRKAGTAATTAARGKWLTPTL